MCLTNSSSDSTHLNNQLTFPLITGKKARMTFLTDFESPGQQNKKKKNTEWK